MSDRLPYGHRPDKEWIERRYSAVVKNLEAGENTIERGDGDEHILIACIDLSLQASAFGWFLGEPVELLRSYLSRGGTLVRHALTEPGYRAGTGTRTSPSLNSVVWWIYGSTLSGDLTSAAEAARRLPHRPPIEQPADHFDVMLAALARGDDQEATRCGEALGEVLQNPLTPDLTTRALAELDVLGLAVAARDQAEVNEVAHRRADAVTSNHRQRVEDRRSWWALLDARAACLLLFAEARGLTPPASIASVPAGLLLRRH